MDVRGRPFRPVAARSLVDVVPQAVGLRDLHFGYEIGAPLGLLEDVGQAVPVAVQAIQRNRGRPVQGHQGKHDAAVAVLVHELVVIDGAVPTAGEFQVRPVGQARVVEMTRLLPARNFAATALDVEEIDGTLGGFLEQQPRTHPEGGRFGHRFAAWGADPVLARFLEGREIEPPKVPAPIVRRPRSDSPRRKHFPAPDTFALRPEQLAADGCILRPPTKRRTNPRWRSIADSPCPSA
jgi:hypothetical protein